MTDPVRTVLAHAPDLMVVRFAFAAGDRGALHSHPHVQSTYVQSGRYASPSTASRPRSGPATPSSFPRAPNTAACAWRRAC